MSFEKSQGEEFKLVIQKQINIRDWKNHHELHLKNPQKIWI